MEILIKGGVTGAREARGIAVIIDVFRASNTILATLSAGASSVVPIASVEDAHAWKKKHPSDLLFGERNGYPLDGFDLGNSPTDAMKLRLKEKRVAITTTNGAQGIVAAHNADLRIIASFANAQAVADFIIAERPQTVTFVPMGLQETEFDGEDMLCAEYLRDLLHGQKPNFQAIRIRLLETKASSRIRGRNQHADLDFCTQLDTHSIVPKVDNATGHITL